MEEGVVFSSTAGTRTSGASFSEVTSGQAVPAEALLVDFYRSLGHRHIRQSAAFERDMVGIPAELTPPLRLG